MGISWSKRHRLHQPHQNQVNHRQQPVTPSSSYGPSLLVAPLEPTPPPPPPPSTSVPHTFRPQTPGQPPEPPSYSFAANAPYHAPSSPPQHFPTVQIPPRPPPPPPPYIPNYSYNNNYSNYYSRPVNIMGQYSNYRPYLTPPMRWGPIPPPPPLPPVPYVDHQSAKKIKNDVNIHKDTIMLQADVLNQDYQLVTFTFDALVDGSITIFYFGKEGVNCTFTPVYPEIAPVKIPFQKGVSQKFCQPSGTGVDLGFFDIDDLSKPSPGEDIYPLVISAESHVPTTPMDEQPYEEVVNTSPNAQITQAVLEKKDEGNFQVKIIKQILWTDGVRYELREIYGISSPDETAISDVDSGKECVICMTEEKNTAVLPCRHMCMCSDCAKELRLQSNKCPICRQPIQELLEIKLDEEAET
ncbi:unnamed protein product [Fraxinus pennsylvanica]|uniref:RING-type E3 ubiquitin transferase n=1 Tax=Fraxinus pennsylvanica TaxID=56036 RepID=A0AAD1ZAB1_9LAMI|nr:unnamed protein product [Fraxinus pennsylvanica]